MRLRLASMTVAIGLGTLALAGSAEAAKTVSGRMSLITTDGVHGAAVDYLSVKTQHDGYVRLRVRGERGRRLAALARKAPGARARVRVTRGSGGALVARSARLRPSATRSATVRPLRPGALKVAVIRVSWMGKGDLASEKSIRKALFTGDKSANAFYKESSAGKVWFEGDVFGTYPIRRVHPDNPTDGCNYGYWGDQAKAAFGRTGYDAYVVVFPEDVKGCPTFGSTNIGFDTATINGSIGLQAAAHEIGHTFGLTHASGLRCRDPRSEPVPMDLDCTAVPYGDPYDVMGAEKIGYTPSERHFNSATKLKLDILGGRIPNATTDGVYTFGAAEPSNTGVQGLRVPRRLWDGGAPIDYYYLEVRTPFGEFDDFSPRSPAIAGVSLRISQPPDGIINWDSPDSLIVDTTPKTGDFHDAPLMPGKSFTDPVYNLTFRVLSVSASGAQVQISGVGNPPVDHVDRDGKTLTFTTTTGRGNSVYVRQEGDRLIVGDSWVAGGARIASPYCEVRNRQSVSCPLEGIEKVKIDTGDLNDEVQVDASVDSEIYAGPGNDHVLGGDSASNADYIDGGSEVDNIHARAGNDVLAAPDTSDWIEGNAGSDWLNMSAETKPVTVSLGDSERQEIVAGHGNPQLLTIDNVLGGSGVDKLIGGPGPNVLLGGVGDDRLEGRGAADYSLGGPGADTFLDGTPGDGDDVFDSRDGAKDRVTSCGIGYDIVMRDLADVIDRASCELIAP